MIRRAFFAAAVLAVAASAAPAQDCATAHEAAMALVEKAGLRVVNPGRLDDVEERCRLSGLTLEWRRPGGVRVEIESVSWQADGLDPAAPFAGGAFLDLEARGLRWRPLVGIEHVDYLLQLQHRRNLTDAVIVARWEPEAARLRLETFKLDLPGPNSLSLRFTLSEVHLGLMALRGLDGFPVALDSLQLSIRNEGYFDALYLPALVDILGIGGQTPAEGAERLRAGARELVGMLPRESFSAVTKDALRALIDEFPAPWGRLRLAVRPERPLPLRQFASSLRGPDGAGLAEAFSGVKVEVSFDPWQGWAD